MTDVRALPVRLGCYLAGGAALAAAGPMLWSTTPTIAAIAATATALCFMLTDALLDTRRLARRAMQAGGGQLTETGLLNLRGEHPVSQTDRDAASAAQVPAVQAPAIPDPVETAASNLLQFAAHVSARCAQPSGHQVGDQAADDGADAIAEAIADGRAELCLQPIVSLADRRTLHYETLSRLRARSGRAIMPASFLPAAEAAGLTGDLDTRQLANIVTLCNRVGSRHTGTRLFCNLAAASLSSAAFRADLIAFMRTHTQLAERIVFEIDAATAAALDDECLADLKTLKALGFAVSIDNVSAAALGSALAVFRHADFIKVDAAVLADADADPLKALMRRGTQIIATRVETEAEAAAVRRLGIGLAQGFLFGRPRPARLDDGQQRRAA